ncbi:MAG: hypothetical protein ACREFX_02110, partial [Opitutaceae bacterium]
MNAFLPPNVPGACYRFIVSSAEEAATLIRERLGPEARVLSVRSVEPAGFKRLWTAPRLEVVAQVGVPEAGGNPAAAGSVAEDPEEDRGQPAWRGPSPQPEPDAAAGKAI